MRTLGADIFADSGQTYPGHAYHDALDVAAQRHFAVANPRSGTIWRTDDGVALRFYSPALPLIANTRNDINNNSLVFRVEYGRFRMLFTGDAGAEAEQRILASGAEVRADVLKVGHRGSPYSSTPAFLRRGATLCRHQRRARQLVWPPGALDARHPTRCRRDRLPHRRGRRDHGLYRRRRNDGAWVPRLNIADVKPASSSTRNPLNNERRL